MKKNIRSMLVAALAVALLAVLLIVPAMAEAEATEVATYGELVEAMAQGGKIKLTNNIVVEDKLSVTNGETVVLDLNGYTLSGVSSTAGTSALITNNGELTIEDSSEAKTGKITTQAEKPDTDWVAGFPAYANNTITNCGILTVNGGRIENTTGEGFCVPIDNNSGSRDAILTVNGGEIVHTNGNVAVRQFANSATHKNTVTVNGGLLEGKRAVWIQLPGSDATKAMNAELIVNDGTLRSTDKAEGGYNLAVYSYSYGNSFANTKLTVKGGTFDGNVALTGASVITGLETVSVTGGTFLGEYGVYSYGEFTEGFISGGTFVADPSDYLADGAEADGTTVEGQWTVHVWSEELTFNGEAHWHYCTNEGCEAKKDVQEHTYVEKEDPVYVFNVSDCCLTYFKSCECGHAGEETFTVIKEDAVHALDFVKPNDVTCMEDGNEEHYHCFICGRNFADADGIKELENVVLPAVGHKLTKMEAKAATCAEDGYSEHYACTCGMLFADAEGKDEITAEKITIPALGHETVYKEFKDKTCTEDGVRDHWYCEVCSEVFGDEEATKPWKPEDAVIPAGHRYKYVEAKGASCTQDGCVEHYRCDCGHMVVIDGEELKEVAEKDVTIPARHNYTSHVPAKEVTCTQNGNVEYWACNDCKVVEIVTEDGRVESTQDKTIIESKGHDLKKFEAVESTCTANGNVEYYHCGICNKNFNADGDELQKVELDAVTHTVREVKAVAPTCTKDGVIAHDHCDLCGKNFDKDGKELTSVVDPAKGHKLTKVEAKAATYTEPGNIEHYSCSVCKKLFADVEGKKEITDVVIPQLIKVEEEKAEVSKDAVDNAIADAKDKAEQTGKPVEVVIEVPKTPVVEEPETPETPDDPEVKPEEKPVEKPQEVVKVELPVQALENVAKEEASLTVVMPSVTVTMDTEVLKSVTEQAAGNTVSLVVEQIKEETLTQKQQEVVKQYEVAVAIKAEFICQETNEKIWTEENNAEKETGNVTVKMPFTPPTGTKGDDYIVLYIADDGTVKEIATEYVDGNLVFALEHFSEYVVVNATVINDIPATQDNALTVPFAMLVVLSFTGMAVTVMGKKEIL